MHAVNELVHKYAKEEPEILPEGEEGETVDGEETSEDQTDSAEETSGDAEPTD